VQSISRSTGYMGAGIAGIILSAGYLHMTLELPMGEIDQPGAGVFPLLVAGILFVASLSSLWEGWQTKANSPALDLPAGADRARLLKLISILLVYFLIIPWAGFSLSSVLFCTLLIRLLSDLTWKRSVVYAFLMTAAIHIIFITILKVPMPSGELIALFRS
jgi:putative tricarboxylic transport membrane protein